MKTLLLTLLLILLPITNKAQYYPKSNKLTTDLMTVTGIGLMFLSFPHYEDQVFKNNKTVYLTGTALAIGGRIWNEFTRKKPVGLTLEQHKNIRNTNTIIFIGTELLLISFPYLKIDQKINANEIMFITGGVIIMGGIIHKIVYRKKYQNLNLKPILSN